MSLLSPCLDGLLHVDHRDGRPGEGERGDTMRYRQGCARVLVLKIHLSFSAAGVTRLPDFLPGSAPPAAPPGPPEAVRHEAVHHWIQTAVQTAQGHRDVIGQHLPRPSDLDPEEDQHLPHVEGGEAEGEDQQDSDQ